MKKLKIYIKAIFAYLYVNAKYAFSKLITFIKSEPSKSFWDRVARISALVFASLFLISRLASRFDIIGAIDNILFIALLECAAIAMSIFASYVYGRIKFTKAMIYGDDGKLSKKEREIYLKLFGCIFIAVHILFGASWSIIQFAEKLK